MVEHRSYLSLREDEVFDGSSRWETVRTTTKLLIGADGATAGHVEPSNGPPKGTDDRVSTEVVGYEDGIDGWKCTAGVPSHRGFSRAIPRVRTHARTAVDRRPPQRPQRSNPATKI